MVKVQLWSRGRGAGMSSSSRRQLFRWLAEGEATVRFGLYFKAGM